MGNSPRLERLVARLQRLSPLQLDQIEHLAVQLEALSLRPQPARLDKAYVDKAWPHAPTHHISDKGTYLVTAGTYYRKSHFNSCQRLSYLESELLSKAVQYGWQLEAWAVFSNHYHFVAHNTGDDPDSLTAFLTHLHADTARELNAQDASPKRKLWYNFRESKLTFQKSYLARLNYVHQNAVWHKLVPLASLYRWCSAAWFERTASLAQVRTIYSFKTDRVKVDDAFDPEPIL